MTNISIENRVLLSKKWLQCNVNLKWPNLPSQILNFQIKVIHNIEAIKPLSPDIEVVTSLKIQQRKAKAHSVEIQKKRNDLCAKVVEACLKRII